MNIGIINALPMSLINKVTTLIPNPKDLKELLHPDDWAQSTEIIWLWGHKNSRIEASKYLYDNFGVVERWEAFGERPTVVAKDDGYYASRIDGELIKIDKLVVLAPKFDFVERKAEGEVALMSEIVGFTPILVQQ